MLQFELQIDSSISKELMHDFKNRNPITPDLFAILKPESEY
jgi:hypothetical protein